MRKSGAGLSLRDCEVRGEGSLAERCTSDLSEVEGIDSKVSQRDRGPAVNTKRPPRGMGHITATNFVSYSEATHDSLESMPRCKPCEQCEQWGKERGTIGG